ncbi:GTP-binding protein GEM isoform X3 [Condylostylus longicornis]|uniref:GTP-binding protein GEM isoform X3 n=1 Tax=Condylostylus longicornis TaxID=2530218 RepID=UPI00244E0225|nr:GTP-binding protein GEM isoform X3 [Condylostylus longicornis]
MGDISPIRPHVKTSRSASICATGSGGMEAAIQSFGPSGSGTPENGTPGYRRRRPATRSQSARIVGGRSVRRKVTTPQQPNLVEHRTHCTSEPRLNETETPPQRRKLSQRKPISHHPVKRAPLIQRKSNAFLDVPTMNMHHLQLSDPEDDDVDRLRTFSASKGGVINRGDSFRRRRSRSNSLAPTSPMHYHGPPQQQQQIIDQNINANHSVECFRVHMLGGPGVGKAALVSQFKTSDCINAYDGPEGDDEREQNISIILNNIESELQFVIDKKETKDELEKADAYLVVYSCVDKVSFSRAEEILSRLQDLDLIRTRPVILIANKIDLARSRAVSAQDGKCLACTFRTKFIEVSVGINHNCDELLAGTLTQIRLKKEQNLLQGERENSPAHWYKSRSVVRASMKARQMITWIFGKEDSKFKHCENLQVL